MRHPNGLRAAAGRPREILESTTIGAAANGGFFAGYISHSANSIATHALIIAPITPGATGIGYPVTTAYRWKTTETPTPGATSDFDGAANTAVMVAAGIANHPAANFCVGLSIGGYDDWYLPALLELDIAYVNLKPNTSQNSSFGGINPYSVPASAANRDPLSGGPFQTPLTNFQEGGAQGFSGNNHWSSYAAPSNTIFAWGQNFNTGTQQNASVLTDDFFSIRAFRKLAL